MIKKEPPQYPKCGVNLTVKLLITESTKYDEDVKKLNTSANLYTALGPNTE